MVLRIHFPASPFLSHLSALPPGVFPAAFGFPTLPTPHWVGNLILSITYSLFFGSWLSFRSVYRLFSEAYSLFCQKQGGGWGCRENLPKLASPSMRGLGVDPMLDVRLQQAQRNRALLQDGVVEGAHVKLAGEPALGFGAQLSDFELAKLVGQRLARPHDVAINLDRDVLIGLASVWLAAL